MAKWSEKPMGATGSSAANELTGISFDGAGNKYTIRHEPWFPPCGVHETKNADNWHNVIVKDGYFPLFQVLNDALNQAQVGKGAERHADGQHFTDQPVLSITRAVGLGFPLGQAMKKIQECQRMDPDAAQRELLGAINYLAAAVLYLEENE